jgi:hypothetical protein
MLEGKMNRPTPPKPPEPRKLSTDSWEFMWVVLIFSLVLSALLCIGIFVFSEVRTKQVDVVVVDKYEGLKHGTTAFFVETCIKNDPKKCELDTLSRRDYDMINIGENWCIEVRNSEYQ